MCEISLTIALAKEKASVDRNIARTPSVRNFCCSAKLHYRTAFLEFDPQPQSSPQPAFGRNARTFLITPEPKYSNAPATINKTKSTCTSIKSLQSQQPSTLVSRKRRAVGDHRHEGELENWPAPRVRLPPHDRERRHALHREHEKHHQRQCGERRPDGAAGLVLRVAYGGDQCFRLLRFFFTDVVDDA